MTLNSTAALPLKWINNRWLWLAGLFCFVLILNREGDRVPTGNEFVYLLYFFKAWHPQFLAHDWTFQETSAGHAVFNLSLGWMARLVSLEAAAWIGRVVCWGVTLFALLRLGRHFRLPVAAAGLGILLWLIQRQSPVTGEWIIGSFEAKCIAYLCLLFAIDLALTGRIYLAAMLSGAAFSYHTAVGLWAGAALGFAILLHYPVRKTATYAGIVILFALPGVITSWQLIFGSHAIPPAEARFFVTASVPDCMDPFAFPIYWLIVLGVLPVFTVAHAIWKRGDRAVRMLAVFELTTAAFFSIGVIARALNHFEIVQLYPLRVYAVFALLFFYLRLIDVIREFARWLKMPPTPRPPLLVGLIGLVLLGAMPPPIVRFSELLVTHLPKLAAWQGRSIQGVHDATVAVDPTDDDATFKLAAAWLRENTAAADVVIAPPWRNDAFYRISRPLIVNWHAPRYDQMAEWHQRLQALVGDISHLGIEDTVLGAMDAEARQHYQSLPLLQITNIQNQYGGQWLLTTGDYNLPLAWKSEHYRIYRLDKDPHAPSK